MSALLTLARADDGEELLTRELLDVCELVRSVVAAMQPVADQRGIHLTRQAPPGVTVSGDQTRLTQLLMNLVDNALRHTRDGGPVDVSVAFAGECGVLRLVDTGVGIRAEHTCHTCSSVSTASIRRALARTAALASG